MTKQPSYNQLESKIKTLEQENAALQNALESLEKNGHCYRVICENLQDVYYEASVEGIFLEVSPSIEKLSLYKREELIGKSLYDIYFDGTKPDRYIDLVTEKGFVSDYELDLTDKDGTVRPVTASTFLITDHQGRPWKLAGCIRDNSRRKQAEASFHQIKEWAETILQTIQSGVFVIDAESHIILDANRAAETMIGAGRDEIVGNACHKFIYPDAGGVCPVGKSKLTADDTEAVLLREDGGRTQIIKTVKAATINGRECLIESFVDISARKQAEAAARAHQERFKTFFSSVNDAIFMHPLLHEGFGPFVEVNDIACKRYGYTKEEFLKLNAADITRKTDSAKHAASDHRKKLLEKRHLVFEAIHIKKNGETFPVEINSNIVEQYGKPVILAVVRDISERRQAEAEKSQIEANYRQAQKVEAIGRLAGGVAHDLNNILSPIIGFGELLIEDMHPEDVSRESIEHIVKAGYRARDLVRQLLAFGRKQTLEYRTVDLNQAIEGFKSLLRRTIREDIEIEINPTADIPNIKADIGQIEQVIMNLCVNAQDAMPQGGKLTLMTSLSEINGITAESRPGMAPGIYVLLSISDTGCGMGPEVQRQIFEPFFSTKGEQGTGLGLSTVYGIVKQHMGNIWVDSELGKGSTFSVYLPVSEEAVAEDHNEDRLADKPKGTESVLLVEDSEQVRNLGLAILKRQGYTMLAAENGAEAIKTLSSHEGDVDLILTDVVMPDMNGKDLFDIISRQYPGIKVLYMSGYNDDVIADRGVLDKGVHFIQKPFTVQSLSAKVREVLDK